MTGEEIEATIDKLMALHCDSTLTVYSTVAAFTDADKFGSYRNPSLLRRKLIGLLEQADPDTHMESPVDANCEPIHVGDKLDGYGKTVEVVELRIGRSGWVIVSRDGNAYADTCAFTHYHAQTIEDVLREFGDEVRRCCDTEDTIAEYAAKLREVMADD